MPEEGPLEFYLRARYAFRKSGDIEDAAELYLSLLNISRHDLSVHPSIVTRDAFTLLKRQGGIQTDISPSGGRLTASGRRYQDALRRQEEEEAKEKARLIAGKESSTWRKKRLPRMWHRALQPFSTMPPTGNNTLREEYNRAMTDTSALMGTNNPGYINHLIDQLYSYRPWSEVAHEKTMESTAQNPGSPLNYPREDTLIREHPLEDIGLFKEQGFHKLFRDIYSPDSDNHVGQTDTEMKRWERKHNTSNHRGRVGTFGPDAVGQHEVFQYGFSEWLKGCKEHGIENPGNEEDFIEHMILRAEGVPEEKIFENFYDEDGSNKGKSVARDLIVNHRKHGTEIIPMADREKELEGRERVTGATARRGTDEYNRTFDQFHQTPKMGLLPYLLGLECFPPEESKQILEWWVSGDHSLPPPGKFFSTNHTKGNTDGRGLLNRIFRMRLGGIANELTRPIIQSRIQQAANYDEGSAAEKEEELADASLRRALSRSRRSEGGAWLDQKYSKSLFHRLSDDSGILPGPDGAHTEYNPVLSEELLHHWVKAGVISDKQRKAVVKLGKRMRESVKEETLMRNWAGPLDTPFLPDGSPSFSRAVYAASSGAGGHGLSGQDVLMALHDMFGGLMTQMEAVDLTTGGDPKQVAFPEDIGQLSLKELEERMARGGSQRIMYDMHQGVLPLVGDFEGDEEHVVGQPELGTEKTTRTQDFRQWLGSLLSLDRSMQFLDAPQGTNNFRDNFSLSLSHNPTLARAVRVFKEAKDKIRGKRVNSRTKLGDSEHIGVPSQQRLRAGESTFTQGSDYSHKPENELDPETNAQLIDLLLGLSHDHGSSHKTFDKFRDYPSKIIDLLLAAKDESVASPLHGMSNEASTWGPTALAGVPLSFILQNLGLLRYIDEEKKFSQQKLSDSPLDNAQGRFAVYRHLSPQDDDIEGLLHGLEPNTNFFDGSSGNNVAQRLEQLRKNPESGEVPIIYPHAFVEGRGGRGSKPLFGTPAKLRDWLRSHQAKPKSLFPDHHQRLFREAIPDEQERRIILEQDSSPDSTRTDKKGRKKTTGDFIDYDTLPTLDPRRHHEIDTPGRATGIDEHTGGEYADEFHKYLLTSGELHFHRQQQRRLAAGTTDVGGGLVQELGGGELSESSSPEEQLSGGYLIAPDPVVLIRDHIETLRDMESEFKEKGEDVGVKRVQDSIAHQTSLMVDFAMNEENGLVEDGGEQSYGRGKASGHARWYYDTINQTGNVAQALKKHYISEDSSLADKFGNNAEGYVNHMALFRAAETLLHFDDDSWRETLAKSMDDLGDVALAKKTRDPETAAHYIHPKIIEREASDEAFKNMSGAFDSVREGKGAERVKGTTLLRYYMENDDSLDEDTKKGALRALKRIDDFKTKKDFINSFTDHAQNVHMDKDGEKSIVSKKDYLDMDPAERGRVIGYHRARSGDIGEDYMHLMNAAKTFNKNSRDTGMTTSALKGDNSILQVPHWSTLSGRNKAARNLNSHVNLARLWDYWDRKPEPPGKSHEMHDRGVRTAMSVSRDSWEPASLLTSRGLKRGLGTWSRPSVGFDHTNGQIPEILDEGWRVGKDGTSVDDSPHPDTPREINLAHVPPNVVSHMMGGDTDVDYKHRPRQTSRPTTEFPEGEETSPAYEPLKDDGGYMWWVEEEQGRSAAHETMSGLDPQDGFQEGQIMRAYDGVFFDMLTNFDLLIKEESGDPPPVKPMHRIFSLEDLDYLRGFSGDWVVSSWPEGERLIVSKDGKKIVAKSSNGKKVVLPNKVKSGLKEASKKDYLIDVIWDGETVLIVDILKAGDEDMETSPTKDRNRHLRANFEATEEVLIPAPINTKRSDEEGLERTVKELLSEPGTKQILLRDAEATYMKGESRHPKWVLLVPEKQLDVLVLSSSKNNHCLGVGPIFEEVAKKIGNRAQEYDGRHYMDVGSLSSSEMEEGQYITVKISGVSKTTRKGESIYRLNAPRYLKDSESGATDSLATLGLLSDSKERNVPHKVRVQKGNVHVILPTGQVIYASEPYGDSFILKDVDYPDNYSFRLAETQREFWAPLAAVLLREEKEDDEKEAVVPEPPANHDKKPKKVIPKKDLIMKDPEVVKGILTILEGLEEILKEKATFTGAKGLGIDYATPVESPHGPTDITEPYDMPDHDPAHRQGKGGDCWCGANKGEECKQGVGHKMEDCPEAHPPHKKKKVVHLKVSQDSQKDSPV